MNGDTAILKHSGGSIAIADGNAKHVPTRSDGGYGPSFDTLLTQT